MRNIPIGEEPDFDATRRTLLRTGLFGALLLGTAGVTAGLSGCTRRVESSALGFRVLRDADVVFLLALIPGVLGARLLSEGPQHDALLRELLQHIDLACYRLGHPGRKALLQLFDLLNMRLTRWATTGVGAWEHATPERVQAFLERWRTSSFAMFNGGYRGLVQLVASAFFATRAGWAAANYPGPPAGPYQALNS
ncbi:MAG: hypothetical protein P4L83_21555 [Nevskia sp.]|nr:hypothetical protein [Nevskia sp.]